MSSTAVVCGDVVDGFQLRRLALLQRVEPRILKAIEACVENSISRSMVSGSKKLSLLALAVEDADNFITDDQRNGQLRTGALDRIEIAGILGDIGRIDRRFSAAAELPIRPLRQFSICSGICSPSGLAADAQSPAFAVEQKDRHMLEVEVVLHDMEECRVEHLVEVKGGDDRLAGVIEDGYFLHACVTTSAG